MIKKEFLELIESQSYCIDGILHELLKVRTYKEFFEQPLIGIKYTDFNCLGENGYSTKVLEFISKNKETSTIVGPIHFFDYLINHNSDNILKFLINEKMNPGVKYESPLMFFKKLFEDFKKSFFDEEQIPFVTNLTAEVLADTTYISIEGREQELKEIQRQLGKVMKNNVVLTGDGGVGKTAIVEEYAIREKDSVLVFELNVLGLIGEKNEAPKTLSSILDALSHISRDKVLFIDEFHILVKMGLADAIKRLTSRGSDIKFIVATTADEFRQYVESDKALERRFFPIPINEIQGDILKKALCSWVNKLQEITGLICDDNVVDFVIEKMSVERQKTSPDKEKDILDAAFSGAKLNGDSIVKKETVAEVMASRLSIPPSQLLSSMFDVIVNLEDKLKEKIVGQDNAIKSIVKTIESSQMRKKKNKPMAVMFFAGPTSVGKTETARQLAKIMFGSEKNLIQIDCSNFKESHTVSSLLGAPPGYVGYEIGGKLVNDIRKKPFSVILFDEFEKAHKDIQDILLPMFEEGIVTDRQGRIADVTNCIVILTSNLGAESDMKAKGAAKSKPKIGFDMGDESEDVYEKKQTDATERYKQYLSTLKSQLKPELISRITEIVIFSLLGEQKLKLVIQQKIDELIEFYKKEHRLEIRYDDSVVDYIYKKSGKNPRKISNSIEKNIESKITRHYIKKHIVDGDTFEIEVIDDVVIILCDKN